jgi:hypothetical protein
LSVDIHQSCWLFFFFYDFFMDDSCQGLPERLHMSKSYVAFLPQFGFDVGAYSGSPSLSTVRHLLKIDFCHFTYRSYEPVYIQNKKTRY